MGETWRQRLGVHWHAGHPQRRFAARPPGCLRPPLSIARSRSVRWRWPRRPGSIPSPARRASATAGWSALRRELLRPTVLAELPVTPQDALRLTAVGVSASAASMVGQRSAVLVSMSAVPLPSSALDTGRGVEPSQKGLAAEAQRFTDRAQIFGSPVRMPLSSSAQELIGGQI